MLQIVRYNWPGYVGALIVVTTAAWWLRQNSEPNLCPHIAAWTALLLAAWWATASLVASYWIYDRSVLYRWTWISSVLPVVPRRWLNLHAGLDESSTALTQLYPESRGQIGDFYIAAEMTERSIQRARSQQGKERGDLRVDPGRLPFADQSFDTVFLLFSAHELRNAGGRKAFLREIHRVLTGGGTVLLVEHTRDIANFAAFGPGFLHFLPASEWRRLASEIEFEIIRESRITPFVGIMLFGKAQ